MRPCPERRRGIPRAYALAALGAAAFIAAPQPGRLSSEWPLSTAGLDVLQPPPQPPIQRGAPPPGRGRGRGAIPVMTLTTSAWTDGGQIPVNYTQAGEEASPPFAW